MCAVKTELSSSRWPPDPRCDSSDARFRSFDANFDTLSITDRNRMHLSLTQNLSLIIPRGRCRVYSSFSECVHRVTQTTFPNEHSVPSEINHDQYLPFCTWSSNGCNDCPTDVPLLSSIGQYLHHNRKSDQRSREEWYSVSVTPVRLSLLTDSQFIEHELLFVVSRFGRDSRDKKIVEIMREIRTRG